MPITIVFSLVLHLWFFSLLLTVVFFPQFIFVFFILFPAVVSFFISFVCEFITSSFRIGLFAQFIFALIKIILTCFCFIFYNCFISFYMRVDLLFPPNDDCIIVFDLYLWWINKYVWIPCTFTFLLDHIVSDSFQVCYFLSSFLLVVICPFFEQYGISYIIVVLGVNLFYWFYSQILKRKPCPSECLIRTRS